MIPELIKFGMVGTWNTVFGYLLLFTMYHFFPKLHYMIIFYICNAIGLVNSYLCYKIFVFKTKKNYLKESAKFYAVVLTNIGIASVYMVLAVEWLKILPLYAQAAYPVFGMFISYFGHKKITFR